MVDSQAKTKICVAGMYDCPNFAQSMAAANEISERSFGKVEVCFYQFFQTQWEEHLRKTASSKKGQYYNHKESPLVTINDDPMAYAVGGEYLGSNEEFLSYALNNFNYLDNRAFEEYTKIAADNYRDKINHSTDKKYAQLMFTINGVDSQVVIELFDQIAPRTCANFIALCRQLKNKEGELIGYAQSEVHRIVKGMFVQMGKIKVKSAEAFASLYGTEFPDESFHVKHTEIGLLGMCKRNNLKHTNESQFYITTGAPLTFLDGENVVFGRVISGMSMIRLIEASETMNERPAETIKICKSGVYKKE